MRADQTDTLHADGGLTLMRPRKPQRSTGERTRARSRTHRHRRHRAHQREYNIGKRRHHHRQPRPHSPPKTRKTPERPHQPRKPNGLERPSTSSLRTGLALNPYYNHQRLAMTDEEHGLGEAWSTKRP
jgi:IS5 family transposase